LLAGFYEGVFSLLTKGGSGAVDDGFGVGEEC